MIKLFSLKQEKEKEEATAAGGKPKVAPGLIRMQKGACARPAPGTRSHGGHRSTDARVVV